MNMETMFLKAEDPQALLLAQSVLAAGGLVVFPTDTVYGVAARAFDGAAVERLYAAKERPVEKAIPVLLGEAGDLEQVAAEVPPMALTLAARFWPGPLTIVVPKHPNLPEAVSATATVGVRIPDHPVARSLLRAAGPLAVTSANRSGLPAPSLADEVRAQLGGRVALILDGGRTPGGAPSTVVDCTGPEPRILRAGPVGREAILACLGLDSFPEA